jgi:hypothetical protein
MDEILYLEPDEEITSVVDKLKGLEADSVGLVAPKGSSIVQSLVSLKLLQKQAKELGKEIAIVTSDEVGQNLAGRINLPVYADVRSRKPIEPTVQKEPEETGPIEITDEPATATAAEIAKEKVDTPKAKEKQKELPEEYKDLPKTFEVHRYDEAEEAEEAVKEPVEGSEAGELKDQKNEEMDRVKEEAPAPIHENNAKFINRPLSERKSDNRIDLESARPTINESKQKPVGLKKKSPKNIIFTIVGIILFIAALLAADLAMAKLQIDLSIPAESITKTVVVTADKDRTTSDYENGIISAKQVDKEMSQEDSYAATGEKETGDMAKGTLSFQNELGADVSISAGATIRSSSGVSFSLDQGITVPKATLDAGGNKVLGKTTGSVTAKQAGPSSNLPANTSFAVEGKSGISSTGSTSGGSTKKVKILTKSDIDSAKKDLISKATEKFKQELKADNDSMFLEDAYTAEASSFTTSKNAGDEADKFTASAKIRIVTLTFSKKDFTQAVIKTAEKGLPEGKSLLVTDKDEVNPALEENQLNIGKLKLKGELKSHIGPKLDLEKMIGGFRLKPIKKVKSEVEAIPGATVKSVNLSPSYAIPFGPILKRNIKLNIEYTNK